MEEVTQDTNRTIDVGYAQLHNDLFLNGRNLTKGSGLHTLDTNQTQGLSMSYDLTEKELLVTYNGVTAHVPSTNVSCYIPGPSKDRKLKQASAPQVASINSAQVGTPQSHVHAGLGHGQTGLSGNVR